MSKRKTKPKTNDRITRTIYTYANRQRKSILIIDGNWYGKS